MPHFDDPEQFFDGQLVTVCIGTAELHDEFPDLMVGCRVLEAERVVRVLCESSATPGSYVLVDGKGEKFPRFAGPGAPLRHDHSATWLTSRISAEAAAKFFVEALG